MVEGTEVQFHCYNQESWKINWRPVNENAVTVDFITSNETGRPDDMLLVANQNYTEEYGLISLIQCLQRSSFNYFANLLLEGKYSSLLLLSFEV